LHVVGDSMMIIKQLDGRRPPLAAHLARLYWHCRVLADYCRVETWTHHYRTYNKTADALVNMAMDTHASKQLADTGRGLPPGHWDIALQNVNRDIGEWQIG
ncbi:hypothetical protein PHYSODRAFT_443986, partial [Phytophthora sojae]